MIALLDNIRLHGECPPLPAPVSDPERRFEGLPVLVEYIDGRRWRLARNCSYRLHDGYLAGRVSTVRTGFVFDWASIPRVFWRLLPPAGLSGEPYGLAALWHDWFYVHQTIHGVPVTRSEADAAFLEIMLYVGVAPWRARLMWSAVRTGGWISWNSRARELAQERPHAI